MWMLLGYLSFCLAICAFGFWFLEIQGINWLWRILLGLWLLVITFASWAHGYDILYPRP
jgi:hypothetical protein